MAHQQAEHEYHFDVKMACSACSGAIERVLSRLEGTWSDSHTGVSSYDVSLEKQTVDVRGPAPFDTVLAKIQKTGKEVLSSKIVS